MAKKKKQSNKQTIIIVVVIILVIALVATYFAAPDVFYGILDIFLSEDEPNPTPNGGTSGTPLNAAEGDLTISFIDVGTGDAMLIGFPDGKYMMIDGGDRDNDAKNAVLDYLTDNSITTLDYVLLTHSDADHCGSLDDVVNAMTSIGTVYMPGLETKEPDLGFPTANADVTTVVYDDFENAVVSKIPADDIDERVIITEGVLTIDGGNYRMTMYCAEEGYYSSTGSWSAQKLNDASPICILEYAGRKVVFTGDANTPTYSPSYSREQGFLDYMSDSSVSSIDCDVLKVGHHGSDGSSCEEFLDFIDCEYAVICVGTPTTKEDSKDEIEYHAFINSTYSAAGKYAISYVNKHGHPTEVVAGLSGRLVDSGVQEIYRTDFFGDIVLTISDEGNMSFTTQKSATSGSGNVITFGETGVFVTFSQITLYCYPTEERKETL